MYIRIIYDFCGIVFFFKQTLPCDLLQNITVMEGTSEGPLCAPIIQHNLGTSYVHACNIQSARVTAVFDLLAYSTNGENLVVTNLHSTNFA
jgi:hypothetical protein